MLQTTSSLLRLIHMVEDFPLTTVTLTVDNGKKFDCLNNDRKKPTALGRSVFNGTGSHQCTINSSQLKVTQ